MSLWAGLLRSVLSWRVCSEFFAWVSTDFFHSHD
jgi:hypothetical protein